MVGKSCSKCGRFCGLDEFHRNRKAKDGRHSQCKRCVLVGMRRYRQTGKYAETRAAWLSREEVRERRREAQRQRRQTEEYRESSRRYARSVRGRVMAARAAARRRLQSASTPQRRQSLRELIAAYTAEIRRMDRSVETAPGQCRVSR